MPRNAKIFFHNSLHFITTSVEEGLMFPPNPLIGEIVKKCLSQAQTLHPVILSDISVQSTHTHFFLQVIDPQDTVDFMARFKCESAHAVNRLLGKKKKTLWCEGYDSPLIDDLGTAINKIAYIYENVTNDDLEDSIEAYPGFNSFSLRKMGARGALRLDERGEAQAMFPAYVISRKDIVSLPKEGHSIRDYLQYRRLLVADKQQTAVVFHPNHWMKRFGFKTADEQIQVNRDILTAVREREEGHRARRLNSGKRVIGRRRLLETPIGAEYYPQRTGRRMLVHSDDNETRKENISWMRALEKRGKEVGKAWKAGDFSEPYPLGLFPPTGKRLAEPIDW